MQQDMQIECLSFYRGKRVLITGNTGFKGSWLSEILILAGAQVFGLSLPPAQGDNIFYKLHLDSRMKTYYADIRNLDAVKACVDDCRAEIVFHLAARSLVREAYREPVETYATNLMGTVHILEAIRQASSVRSAVIVTTDKVYENREWLWGYREGDALGGVDPYANSKACAEYAVAAYNQSFLREKDIRVSTARAGNVLGGGDFAPERLIPDCFRAVSRGEAIAIRNPEAVRPYQYVIDALDVYLRLAAQQIKDSSLCGAYNVGPAVSDCVNNAALADMFCTAWGENARWVSVKPEFSPHESTFLRLENIKACAVLKWKPRTALEKVIKKTVHWYRAYLAGHDMQSLTEGEIAEYFNGVDFIC